MQHGLTMDLITPMTYKEKLDFTSLESLLEWHATKCRAYVDNLCILGTTGESLTLNLQQCAQVLE